MWTMRSVLVVRARLCRSRRLCWCCRQRRLSGDGHHLLLATTLINNLLLGKAFEKLRSTGPVYVLEPEAIEGRCFPGWCRCICPSSCPNDSFVNLALLWNKQRGWCGNRSGDSRHTRALGIASLFTESAKGLAKRAVERSKSLIDAHSRREFIRPRRTRVSLAPSAYRMLRGWASRLSLQEGRRLPIDFKVKHYLPIAVMFQC